MKYRLKKHSHRLKGKVRLESSKSESNRALIVNALSGNLGTLTHLAEARDTETMKSLLSSTNHELDVKDAGTTMRFLTAYLAIKGSGQVITGTDRMKKRPIGPLVDALQKIGATIEYLEEEGFPPLKINKLTTQNSDRIRIPGNISSQYISALMMIAPSLPNGLEIELTTEVYSRPYIELTQNIMHQFGAESTFENNLIKIASQNYIGTKHAIEGDWSGASYWYSFIVTSTKNSSLSLPRIRSYSSQGDQVISEIMFDLGVTSQYEPGIVKLQKGDTKKEVIDFDFRHCPDLAQTVMAAAAVSGTTLKMIGLESLKIKETDRVEAMKTELAKLGATLSENDGQWILNPSNQLPDSIDVTTYDDHRMAMAFAPLCQLMDVIIDDPTVVNKSYPGFWEEVKKLGIEIEEF